MTMTLFMFLLSFGASVTSLFTEALKRVFENVPSNVIALVSAVVVGIGGTSAVYVILEIPFDIKNIVCIILMTFCIWLSAMVGYDKLKQTLDQLKGGGLS